MTGTPMSLQLETKEGSPNLKMTSEDLESGYILCVNSRSTLGYN